MGVGCDRREQYSRSEYRMVSIDIEVRCMVVWSTEQRGYTQYTWHQAVSHFSLFHFHPHARGECVTANIWTSSESTEFASIQIQRGAGEIGADLKKGEEKKLWTKKKKGKKSTNIKKKATMVQVQVIQ